MRIRTVTAAVATIIFTGVFSQAPAQDNQPLGALLRFGIFWPSNSESSAIGDTWLTGGAELRIAGLRSGATAAGYSSSLSISVDAYSRGGASSVPILLNYVGSKNRMHYAVGAGVSVAERPDHERAVKFAYQVLAGYDWSTSGTPLTVEIRWFTVADVGSTLDGFAVTIGIRM